MNVLLKLRMNCSGKIFNAGYENQTVNHLASLVKEVVGDEVKIKHIESNDNRSYLFHLKN